MYASVCVCVCVCVIQYLKNYSVEENLESSLQLNPDYRSFQPDSIFLYANTFRAHCLHRDHNPATETLSHIVNGCYAYKGST